MDTCCSPSKDEKSLKIAIILTSSLFVLELVGGFLSVYITVFSKIFQDHNINHISKTILNTPLPINNQ